MGHPIRVLVVLLLSLIGRRVAADGTDGPVHFSRFTLRNGLSVYLEEDHRQPLVAIRVTYGIGSRDDPSHRSGLAHLVEHLTFRGSSHLKDGQISGLYAQAGSSDANAGTGADETSYYATVSSGGLGLGLWLESERMAFTAEALSPVTLAAERELVTREVESQSSRETQLLRALSNAMFGAHHPYWEQLAGASEVSQITLDQARAALQEGYRPDNARIVLVGDFDSSQARGLIERYFDSVANPNHARVRAALPAAGRAPGGHFRFERNLLRRDVALGWLLHVEDLHDMVERDLFLALFQRDWLKHFRAGDTRLLSLDVYVDNLALGSLCAMDANLSQKMTPDAGALVVHEGIRRIALNQLSVDVEGARRQVLLDLAARRESLAAWAGLQMQALANFGRPVDAREYIRELNTITADDLSRLAAAFEPNAATRVDSASADDMQNPGAPPAP